VTSPPGRGIPPPTGPDGQDARPWYKKKRVLIPAGVVAFFVVIAIATGGDDPAPSAEADELIAATEAAEARADEAEARADEAEARLDDVEEAAAAESDETEEAEAEEEADAAAEGAGAPWRTGGPTRSPARPHRPAPPP